MSNVKFIILRCLVFLLVFAVMIFIVTTFLISGNSLYSGDSGANIKVWLDKNGNGKQDKDEPFLPNICVWAGYASSPQNQYIYSLFSNWQEICKNQWHMTDQNGAWENFFAGGSCTEIYSAIHPPDGYFPTTEVVVNGCMAEFGLTQERPINEIQLINVEEYLQKQYQKERTVFWLKIGLALMSVSIFAGFVSIKIIRSEVSN